jgi:hypothetical protein
MDIFIKTKNDVQTYLLHIMVKFAALPSGNNALLPKASPSIVT